MHTIASFWTCSSGKIARYSQDKKVKKRGPLKAWESLLEVFPESRRWGQSSRLLGYDGVWNDLTSAVR